MFARLGLVARGIAYIVIRTIAVMVAFGVARHGPDQAGPSIAHCAAWPAASQPSRFDIACAQLTTACTWSEASAARHSTDHG
jgi:hypothetical protein